MKLLVLAASALVGLSTMVQAHPGDHSGVSFLHALTQPDHLAAVAGVAVFAYVVWFFRAKRA
jgi:hydrogenase/urease accessory protein HupE